MELTFEFERETKGAVRYLEVTDGDEEAVVGTLYLRKWAAADLSTAADQGKPWPEKLTVNIAAA